jgi:hypothetical protein
MAAAGAGYDSRAVPTVLLALAFAIVCAKLAGELVERLGEPAVLGELIVGILAGNATLLGGPDLSALASSEALTVMAELGAVLLLFQWAGVDTEGNDGGRRSSRSRGRGRRCHAHDAGVRSRRVDATSGAVDAARIPGRHARGSRSSQSGSP